MKNLFAFLFIIIFLASCTYDHPNKEGNDTTTAGNILIVADESYQPIIDSQLFVFQSLYPKAKVKCIYTSRQEAYNYLFNDSARLVIVGEEPDPEHIALFDSIKIKPRITKLAKDAIALIVHPQNPDSTIDLDKLAEVFRGKITDWSLLNKNNKNGKIEIVFDNNGSSNAHYIKTKFCKDIPFPENCYALKGNKDVIDYVAQHPNAIGVISINWISDRDDPQVEKFLQNIKLIAIADSTGMEGYFKPYQAYIALKKYPLHRNMVAVSKEARAGLGTGFVSFIAGDKGQRMVLKSGMVPINAPVRIISNAENQ